MNKELKHLKRRNKSGVPIKDCAWRRVWHGWWQKSYDTDHINPPTKIYNEEDFNRYKCQQCGIGFLKKWLLEKHNKDTHHEERRNDISDKNIDQHQIEDQIKHKECVQEPVNEPVVNNYVSSNNKHPPKGGELNCLLCQKTFKSENTLKTYDLWYHMKKGLKNGYFCEYCTKSFLAKVNLLGHITNEHKKCDVCKNIFPSDKVLESHKRSVHKKVQFKHTIEREPSLRNHKNKKYTY